MNRIRNQLDEALEQPIAEALERQFLQDVSRSFALTIPQLPHNLGRTVANAYLLCRIVDTIEDDAALSIDQKRLFFRRFVEIFDPKRSASAESFAAELVPLLSEQTLPAEKKLLAHTPHIMQTFFTFNHQQQIAIRHCVWKMSSGMLGFQEQKSGWGLNRLADMDRYCYYVAGVVGEMLTELFCDHSAAIARQRSRLMALAPSFGQGLQMTNILKDLWDDSARGANWLPREVFETYGFDLNRLAAGTAAPGFGQGLTQLIGIARWHLANALDYTLLIPANETGIRRFCLWAIGMAVYTLRKINTTQLYSCARDVKISRRTTKRIILVSNAAVKSNFLLKTLFAVSTHGLPDAGADMGVPATEFASHEERQSCVRQ